jgi:TM2 domain-containing membrane protein YozV
MNDELVDHGHAELFKAGIHFGIFGLAAMCLGYNAMAFGQRGERRLLVNTILYAAALAFETNQIVRHLTEKRC